jgi:mono/diheme cytochrome c family protein
VIVSGYEPLLVLTNDRERIAGTKKEDTPEHFVIGLPTGEIKKIMKTDVKKFKIMKKSIMPSNFAEILSVEEFHDILAYVRTLTGEQATVSAEEQPTQDAPAEEQADDGKQG